MNRRADPALFAGLVLALAGGAAAAPVNTVPVCASAPLAVTQDTVFTADYYGTPGAAPQYVLFKNCSGSPALIDSFYVDILKGDTDQFEAGVPLKETIASGDGSGNPNVTGYVFHYHGQVTYRVDEYPAGPTHPDRLDLSVDPDSIVVTPNPQLAPCIFCLAKAASGATAGDSLALRLNFRSAGQVYSVVLMSVARFTVGIQPRPVPARAASAPRGTAGPRAFFQSLIGRKIGSSDSRAGSPR